MTTCTVDGCTKSATWMRMCQGHAHRQRRHGSPHGGRRSTRRQQLTDLMAVDTDHCVIWPHAVTTAGYPKIGRGPDGHVIVCSEAHGPRPTPGHEAAHSCGVRRCVNPRHLRWATTAENHADKHAHGTDARGERNPAHRLTADQVVAIRSRLARGEHTKDLAAEHGVVPSTIQHIAAGTTWAWLTSTMEDQK